MGIRVESLGLLFLAIGNKKPLKGMTMCELGDQMVRVPARNDTPAKELFEMLGMNHTSIDWNGNHGAEAIDLSDTFFVGKRFDIVTNFGTSEHVKGQYECFANIHRLCRKGGIMVHQVPMIGRQGSFHGIVNYHEDFFTALAKRARYKKVMQGLMSNFPVVYCKKQGQVFSVLRKREANDFISADEFKGLSKYMKGER